MASIGLETPSVAAYEPVKRLPQSVAFELGEQLLDRHDEGWVADDPELAVDDCGELAQGLKAVTGTGFGNYLASACGHPFVGLRPRCTGCGLELGEKGGHVDVRVPDVQGGHPGQPAISWR